MNSLCHSRFWNQHRKFQCLYIYNCLSQSPHWHGLDFSLSIPDSPIHQQCRIWFKHSLFPVLASALLVAGDRCPPIADNYYMLTIHTMTSHGRCCYVILLMWLIARYDYTSCSILVRHVHSQFTNIGRHNSPPRYACWSFVCLSVCLPDCVCLLGKAWAWSGYSDVYTDRCVLPARESVCVSVCLCVHVSVSVSVCVSVCLCVCLSVCPSVRPSIHLAIVCLSVVSW